MDLLVHRSGRDDEGMNKFSKTQMMDGNKAAGSIGWVWSVLRATLDLSVSP